LPWSPGELAGRLVELSAWGDTAALTLAFELIAEAQHQGEPAAWITATPSTFYPPDAARSGIDLDALPVVRVADAQSAARAADKLARSGAFGLLVLDVHNGTVPAPLQTRLLGLAAKHDTAVVFLTEKQSDAPSLGSLVSLRAQASRRRTSEDKFSCEARIVKDKRRGPGWSHSEIRHGPAGLR
jgi:recombination protein RecA